MVSSALVSFFSSRWQTIRVPGLSQEPPGIASYGLNYTHRLRREVSSSTRSAEKHRSSLSWLVDAKERADLCQKNERMKEAWKAT